VSILSFFWVRVVDADDLICRHKESPRGRCEYFQRLADGESAGYVHCDGGEGGGSYSGIEQDLRGSEVGCSWIR